MEGASHTKAIFDDKILKKMLAEELKKAVYVILENRDEIKRAISPQNLSAGDSIRHLD